MRRDDLDPYAILGVTRDASLLEIARARRRLAKLHHPDVASETEPDGMMQSINTAWEMLSDSGRRDEWLGRHPSAVASHWGGQPRAAHRASPSRSTASSSAGWGPPPVERPGANAPDQAAGDSSWLAGAVILGLILLAFALFFAIVIFGGGLPVPDHPGVRENLP
ncbi:MAG TPA: J domain-containing protein [Candidatus Limnocylindria bacterium]|jgi:curved DNA-binding protein CbpA|nr:J domain-containing protein [Candidatus Limnocylindria bacterium]